MKKILFTTLLGLFLSFCYGQSDELLPDFSSLKAPLSPAFTLLNITPTTIDKPGTPNDLAISLVKATSKFKLVPENFAIEFSPYWMSSKPQHLTWKEDIDRNFLQSVSRTFAISAATCNIDTNIKLSRSVSFGFRTMLISGKTENAVVQNLTEKENELTKQSKTIAQLEEELEGDLKSKMAEKLNDCKDEVCREEILEWYNMRREYIAQDALVKYEENQESKDASINKIEDDLNYNINTRNGFQLELAGAIAYKSDTNDFTRMEQYKTGLWLTPSYTIKDFDFLGITRVIQDTGKTLSAEVGVRTLFSKPEYSVSFEILKGYYMNNDKLDPRIRIAVLAEYMILNNLWIVASIGTDNKNVGNTSTLFSNIGLSYNISSKRYEF